MVAACVVAEAFAEAGRATRGFLAGGSLYAGSVMVEAWCFSLPPVNETLDAFEIESKILWNFRLEVLRATGILESVKEEARCRIS